MRVHDSVDELGLPEIVPRHQAHDFSDMIASAEHLAIVINDGTAVGWQPISSLYRFDSSGWAHRLLQWILTPSL